MPTLRADAVINDLQSLLSRLSQEKLPRAITEMLINAQSYSANLTSIATSNLINSQYRKVTRQGDRVVGEIGYGAKYALYVHNAPGTLKGLGVPRHPRRLGYVWDPDAEPRFLIKGIRKMAREDAEQIIQSIMRL